MRLPDARVFDPRVESIDPVSRREAQTRALRAALARVAEVSPFYRQRLDRRRALDALAVGDLRAVPFTTRADLVADQAATPPFGTVAAVPAARAVLAGRSGVGFSVSGRRLNVFVTAGDVRRQAALVARALWEAGVRPGERVYVADDPRYNLVAISVLRAVCALGAVDVYVGAERSSRTARYVVPVLPPAHVFLSPTYAGYLPGVLAAGSRWPIRSISGWGEPGYSIPETRARLRARWDGVSACPPVSIVDLYALSETGAVAFGCREGGGLHVFEDAVAVEIVDPAGDRVRPPGERGEIVVTRLDAQAWPLVRYRTGDAAALDDSPCACGRTGRRLIGIERLAERVRVGGRSVSPADVERALEALGVRATSFVLLRPAAGANVLTIKLAAGDASGAAPPLDAALARALGVAVSVDAVPGERLPPFVHKTLRVVDAAREAFLAEELGFQQELERV